MEAVARGQWGSVYFGLQHVYVPVKRPAVARRLEYGKSAESVPLQQPLAPPPTLLQRRQGLSFVAWQVPPAPVYMPITKQDAASAVDDSDTASSAAAAASQTDAMEAALRRWCTPRQQLVLDALLKPIPLGTPSRDRAIARLLEEKVTIQSDRIAQLDGLTARPELNGRTVEIIGSVAADGRVAVRVRNVGDIRVLLHKLAPPDPSRAAVVARRNRHAGASRPSVTPPGNNGNGDSSAKADEGTEHLMVTELSLELSRRRQALFDFAENLSLTPQHLADHQNFINSRAEKLAAVASHLKRECAITNGMYKLTKDPDKIIQLHGKEESMRRQQAAYNANVSWLRAESEWLMKQPAMEEALAAFKKSTASASSASTKKKKKKHRGHREAASSAAPAAAETVENDAAGGAETPEQQVPSPRRCMLGETGQTDANVQSLGVERDEEDDADEEPSFEALLAEIKAEIAAEEAAGIRRGVRRTTDTRRCDT